MANLKQDMQLALSMGRNRFITSWDKFIMLVADYFLRDHFPNILPKGCSSYPNLNGLILALRRREGFSIGKFLPNGVRMRYDSMELGLQAEFRITRGRDGEVELDNMSFSIGNVPKDWIYRAIPLTGDESELAECIEGFFTNDLPALLKEAKLVYTENSYREKLPVLERRIREFGESRG